MEHQMDTLKVYKHCQHARIQNEDVWISSEDLRTEGSSDEDTQLKSHRHKRNRKLKQTESILNTSKDIFSVAPKFSDLLDVPTKDPSCSFSKIEKPRVDKMDSAGRCPSGSSKLLPDIFLDGTPGTSGISLGSTDADMDALNLESRWRPKRGSLKYPILVEGQTTENYIHEVKGFYEDLMSKLKSLRTCPAITRFPSSVASNVDGSKLFKDLKHTPEVREKLKCIQQLDNEIKETIQAYKTERAERLQAQDEMCNEIYKNKAYPPRDTQLFLEMCHFEASEDANNGRCEDSKNAEPDEVNTENRQQQNRDFANNFIKRNIELAKEGAMAGCSLTDEEKRTLADLLTDVDSIDDEDVTKMRQDHSDFYVEEDEDSESEACYISNAYIMSEDEKQRVDDIDNELEKFKLDETDKEKIDRNSIIFRQRQWKDVLLEHRLKNIDAQLTDLHKSYENDEKISAENDNDVEDIEASPESDAPDSACVSDCSDSEKL